MPARVRSATKVDLIAGVPLFAALPKSELGKVRSIADEIDLPADKVLIREGERGREFFVLLEGEADVARKGQKLATRGAGEFFGEIALVSNLPRTATVKTRNPVRAGDSGGRVSGLAPKDTCDCGQGVAGRRRPTSRGRGLASRRPFRPAGFRSKLVSAIRAGVAATWPDRPVSEARRLAGAFPAAETLRGPDGQGA